MGDKDPSPFGYTFTGGYLDSNDFAHFDAAHSLLTHGETQTIADFFSNTDPFLADHHFSPDPSPDAKHPIVDCPDWNSFMQPATVHGVSTTLSDQDQLHTPFFPDPAYTQPSAPGNLFGTTHDDLQAASTLFQNSQSSYANNRSHAFQPPPPPPQPQPQPQPPSQQPPAANDTSALDSNGKPLIITPHGLINEQLAALIPNHNKEGTLDAQFAAQWVGHHAPVQTPYHKRNRPNLKRSYTFGTDDSFNNPGHATGPCGETTENITRRMIRDMRHAEAPFRVIVDENGEACGRAYIEELSEDEPSEDTSSEEEEDVKPAKKRRKSKSSKESIPKGARSGKRRKSSTAEECKRKRASAAQKLQRENLTEEQKRSNHILSEQKRRNLIKRGFDDLHDLVPEIRNGGLSKSSILTEAANFLENLIMENKKYRKLMGG